MTRSLEKSNETFQTGRKTTPTWGLLQLAGLGTGPGRLYVEHTKGARIWDIDGNEYIDYRIGYGPAILGHCG